MHTYFTLVKSVLSLHTEILLGIVSTCFHKLPEPTGILSYLENLTRRPL